MKLKTLFAGALLAVFGLTVHAANNGSFIHYTPEKLDAVTQADIDDILAKPRLPRTEEGINALVKKLAGLSYEQYAAVYPEFSTEYNVDPMVDRNGWKTLKLTYKMNRSSIPVMRCWPSGMARSPVREPSTRSNMRCLPGSRCS